MAIEYTGKYDGNWQVVHEVDTDTNPSENIRYYHQWSNSQLPFYLSSSYVILLRMIVDQKKLKNHRVMERFHSIPRTLENKGHVGVHLIYYYNSIWQKSKQ